MGKNVTGGGGGKTSKRFLVFRHIHSPFLPFCSMVPSLAPGLFFPLHVDLSRFFFSPLKVKPKSVVSWPTLFSRAWN